MTSGSKMHLLSSFLDARDSISMPSSHSSYIVLKWLTIEEWFVTNQSFCDFSSENDVTHFSLSYCGSSEERERKSNARTSLTDSEWFQGKRTTFSLLSGFFNFLRVICFKLERLWVSEKISRVSIQYNRLCCLASQGFKRQRIVSASHLKERQYQRIQE